MYIDSRTEILYYCTQLVQMCCTSVNTTHINWTHMHTDIAFYVYRFMYRYTVLLYTTCREGLCFCVHNFTLMYNLTLPTHTCGTHIMLGSVVLLYVYTVVQSVTPILILTNESTTNITGLIRVDQSQLPLIVTR